MEIISTSNKSNASESLISLEKNQEFSKSILWGLQKRFYNERGVEAWRFEEVPHYVTTNPRIANDYAEIVISFLQDHKRISNLPTTEPLHILELGAGMGRFAYHFLSRLVELSERYDVPLDTFRYIISDVVQDNLDFCKQHPRFLSFIEKGILDFTVFDVDQSETIELQISCEIINKAALQLPLVVFANYVLDGVPHDIFHFDNGKAYKGYVSLSVDEAMKDSTVDELLLQMQYELVYREVPEAPFDDVLTNQIFSHYCQKLKSTHLLFPSGVLRCLQRLKEMSLCGMLLLTADKGTHRLHELEDRPPPPLVSHGGFSFSVNFHAISEFCGLSGGLAYFPQTAHYFINVGCLLFVDQPSEYVETYRAYENHIEDFGPDAFHAVVSHVRENIDTVSMREILSYLKLSFHDSYLFSFFLPRLLKIAPEVNSDELKLLIYAIDHTWNRFFPIGESECLANQIACLLYVLGEYSKALDYFTRSIEINGPNTGTLYNMAVCYRFLDQHTQAHEILSQVVEYDSNNHDAYLLLSEYDDVKQHDLNQS